MFAFLGDSIQQNLFSPYQQFLPLLFFCSPEFDLSSWALFQQREPLITYQPKYCTPKVFGTSLVTASVGTS